MADTLYSIVTGIWKDGNNWSHSSGGAAAGHYPVSGDTAIIETVKITSGVNPQCKIVDIKSSELEISGTGTGDLILDDVAGAQIIIRAHADAKLTNLGTYSSPAKIRSVSAVPTNPWTIRIEDMTGEDARTLNFDYLSLYGNLPFLGNDGYAIDFAAENYLAESIPRLTTVPLMTREGKMDNHFIDGRAYSRVYDRGMYAGAVTVEGYVYASAFFNHRIHDMRASGQRLAFINKHPYNTYMPKCRIERFSMRPRPGSTIIPYSLTLIEDR